MHVHEVIRGLALGGAETLLALRLESRAADAPEGEYRTVFNAAPSQDFFAERVAACVDGYSAAPTDSVLKGVVASFTAAGRTKPGAVVVLHSPAPAIGYKLYSALRNRRFTLVEVVHNTRYRPVYVLLGRLLNRQVDLCVCVSSAVAVSRSSSGFRRKDTILGGVDAAGMRLWKERNPGAPETMRAELGLGPGSRLLVNVGNLNPRKNQEQLVRALAGLGPDTHLVVLGEGPERPRLVAAIDELGLGRRVHLLGSQPGAWRWIAVADLMVHPSHHEGLPVVVMEALTLGTPTLATAFGGVDDVLREGTNLTVTTARSPAALTDAIARRLVDLPSIEQAWPSRLGTSSQWDIERYTDEFYAALTRAAAG